MSTRCNVVIKEESNPRREIILYRHNDGYPEAMVPAIVEMMKDAYSAFCEARVKAWITEPSKVSSMLIHLSIPKLFQDENNAAMKELKKLKGEVYEALMRTMLPPLPTLEPDNSRNAGASYEYTITLSEKMEGSSVCTFYELEVGRMQNGKKIYVISNDVHVLGGEFDDKFRTESGDTGNAEGQGANNPDQGLGQD